MVGADRIENGPQFSLKRVDTALNSGALVKLVLVVRDGRSPTRPPGFGPRIAL